MWQNCLSNRESKLPRQGEFSLCFWSDSYLFGHFANYLVAYETLVFVASASSAKYNILNFTKQKLSLSNMCFETCAISGRGEKHQKRNAAQAVKVLAIFPFWTRLKPRISEVLRRLDVTRLSRLLRFNSMSNNFNFIQTLILLFIHENLNNEIISKCAQWCVI